MTSPSVLAESSIVAAIEKLEENAKRIKKIRRCRFMFYFDASFKRDQLEVHPLAAWFSSDLVRSDNDSLLPACVSRSRPLRRRRDLRRARRALFDSRRFPRLACTESRHRE